MLTINSLKDLQHLAIVLIILPLIVTACNNNRHFDKISYLQSCNLSIDSMVLQDYAEVALSEIAFSRKTDSTLMSFRNKFVNQGSMSSGLALLRSLANKYSFTREDSLLFNHYYASGVSRAKNANEVISLTLAYAKKMSFDSRKNIGVVSFPFVKNNNDTLAAISISRIVEGIIKSDKKTVSDDKAREIVKWCKTGLYYSSSTFNVNYLYILNNLTYFAWKINDSQWQSYADSLFTYKKRQKSTEYNFEGPLYDLYLSALRNNNFEKAEDILNHYSENVDDTDSVYVPLRQLLPERPRWDYKIPIDFPSSKEPLYFNRNTYISLLRLLNGSKVNMGTAYCVERARINYLKGAKDYAKWLNRSFYEGVMQLFPTTADEFIENYLHPEYTYNQSVINLLTYQYNNNDPKSVYDALLFVKGASETIPISIYMDIKQHSPQSIIDYADSIREYNLQDSFGKKREYLESIIGENVKSTLNKCIASYSDIKDHLKPTDIAIEFYAAPALDLSGTYSYRAAILCADLNEPALVDICSDKILKDILLSGDLYNSDKAYNLIVAPLENYLSGKQTVYYSMDGLLYLCNLPALLSPQGIRLSQRFGFEQLTSTKEILSTHDTTRYESIALFGGIDYSTDKKINSGHPLSTTDSPMQSILRSFKRDDFSPLPFSKREIDEISHLANANNLSVKYFSSNHGTEEAFKQLSGQKLSILHIATHGFYYSINQKEASGRLSSIARDDNPLNRCGLLFAGGKNSWRAKEDSIDHDDGFLLGTEIEKLDFSNVDLVVLSACKSALGDISSEGVTGLRQAFKRAGAKSILLTLNNVDDKATAFFMKAFYEKMFSTKDKYNAFDYAVKQMKSSEEFSDASYWTPFILID